jgi:acyl carrier protein
MLDCAVTAIQIRGHGNTEFLNKIIQSVGVGRYRDYNYDYDNTGSRWQRDRIVGTEQGAGKNSDMLVLRQEFPLLGPYVAPRTPTEHKLAEIFCSVLGMDEVSVTDDFEELGGDSLVAASICTDIEGAFAIVVPIAYVMRSPTIEQLAPRIDELVSKHKA